MVLPLLDSWVCGPNSTARCTMAHVCDQGRVSQENARAACACPQTATRTGGRTEGDEALVLALVDVLDALELERPLPLREGDGGGVVDGLAGSLELLKEHLADDNVVLVLEVDREDHSDVVALPLQVDGLVGAVVDGDHRGQTRLAVEHSLEGGSHHGALEKGDLARQSLCFGKKNEMNEMLPGG